MEWDVFPPSRWCKPDTGAGYRAQGTGFILDERLENLLAHLYRNDKAVIAYTQYFHVPVVFAKKAQSVNLDGEMYTTKVESFTHKKVYDVILSKKFLGPEDHVLLIDDFLANGCALLGLIDIVKKSGATLEGAGIVIEKGFQSGGQTIRDMGIHLESLAIIDSIEGGKLTFRE